MTIPETISVSQTAKKAFEQKKYLKNLKKPIDTLQDTC